MKVAASCSALVLDFGGVISKTVFETHPQSEAALGVPTGTLNWMGPFDPASDPMWCEMQDDRISERDYWYMRAAETGRLVGEEWVDLPSFLQRIRGDDPAAMIRPEALEAIRAAKNAGRKLAILSNELDLFYGSGFRDKLPFLADFDAIVDATYTKVLKPDPRSYGFVTSALGVAAEECVFVDDQLRNITGARNVGMRTVHFDVTRPSESYSLACEALGISAGE
ncbi:HAD family hydrolase [Sinorhizobium fredii]|uniref:HAD superfamily hydrolase protein n=1 Tax=Rhizobium fredii TaxID=380 RepID=A0A2L0HB19_RHIFR|nr:HAD-IA family hydrolase [Sinorhizobium fredii]AUX78392.1 HAD superfamily hydrolase protein [Sinorhizobium fredii]